MIKFKQGDKLTLRTRGVTFTHEDVTYSHHNGDKPEVVYVVNSEQQTIPVRVYDLKYT